MTNQIELLSPAGDFEALRAAVQCGADAVYIGGKTMSARKSAKNFSEEEIGEAAEYCRERGVKLYLAINTLMRPGEEKIAAEAVKTAAKSGVDALIIQDLGVAEIARRVCPGLPRHASTQLTAHSVGDVKALTELGFSRVVVSRELSEGEIENIYRSTGCEIEAFVHGALCVCFSGRCLMSSFIGGRSGNRGCCAQPCRQRYFSEGKQGYFLSPRDLSLVHKLDAMKRAGVVSFKIEGRMKSSEYVAVVTGIYRKALDGIPLTQRDEDDLKNIFSRGGAFTEGYFSGINTPEMMNYNLSNDKISSSVPKELITRAQGSFRQGIERPRVGVKMELSVTEGSPVSLSVTDGEGSLARAEGKPPQRAESAPVTADKAAEHLGKTGGTPYYASCIKAEIGEGLFVPAAELNTLRRQCFEELSRQRRIAPKMEYNDFRFEFKRHQAGKQRIFAKIGRLDQLKAAESADKVIIPLELTDNVPFKENYAAALPQIVLDGETVKRRLSRLPKGTEVYSSTLGGLRLIREAGLTPVGDFGLNISNSVSAKVMSELVSALTLSPELNFKEITDICAEASVPIEIIGYGRQTVMVSRACMIRGIRGRCECKEPVFVKDKTGAEFPILGERETHLNIVLNSRPTFMADKLKQLRSCGADAVQLCFTLENSDETAEIIALYCRGGEMKGEFTRGYFFKN